MSQLLIKTILYVTSLSLMVAIPFIASRQTRSEGKWKAEEFGMLLSVYALPFFVFFSMSQIGGPSPLTLTKFVTLYTLIIWLINAFFINRDINIFTNLFKRPTSICNLMWPVGAGVTMLQMDPADTGLGMKAFLFAVLPQLVYYVLMVSTIKRQVVIRWCLIAIIIGNTFACIGGVYEALTGRAIVRRWVVTDAMGQGQQEVHKTSTGKFRISSFNVDPDLHSQAVVFGLGPILGFLLLAKKRSTQIFFILLALLFIFNSVGTSSKAGWIGLLVILFTFACLMKIKRKWLIISSGIAVILFSFWALEMFTDVAIVERFTQEGGSGTMSNMARFADWKVSLIVLWDKPLFGHGFTSSMSNFYKLHHYAPDMIPRVKGLYQGHIASYTLVMSETGLVGMFLFFGAYAFCLKDLLFLRKFSPDPFWTHMSAGLFASLTANLVMMLFHPIISSETQLVYMAMVSNAMTTLLVNLKANNLRAKKPEANWRFSVATP